ncbi:dihydrofolate reductase family protein [Nonomuraea rubra]|uniref:Riboflavin biosynthesis pyrimidine reductase n=1 Tax=Nonomuraea rubra TaxID=46180 RepID=A0A7X0U0S7_9ACTN|nr:dihydrofolate reductase family protein [Nonomuraea rubra]MBB6550936.1 riboflavin biosynthesis pyrimidine reductase [Nonomuraea rubra]
MQLDGVVQGLGRPDEDTRAGLIDRYTLLIHPLTLGSGARLFEGPAPLTEFELTGSVTTGRGVIIADYIRR